MSKLLTTLYHRSRETTISLLYVYVFIEGKETPLIFLGLRTVHHNLNRNCFCVEIESMTPMVFGKDTNSSIVRSVQFITK